MNQSEMSGAATRRAMRHHFPGIRSARGESSDDGPASSPVENEAVKRSRMQRAPATSGNSRPAPLYKAPFTAAWLPGDMILEGFTDGLLWRKRWGMPKFTFEQAQRLFPHLPGLAYNAATDSFTMPHADDEPTEKEMFAGESVTLDGKTITLYAIGAGSWCWDSPAPIPLR